MRAVLGVLVIAMVCAGCAHSTLIPGGGEILLSSEAAEVLGALQRDQAAVMPLRRLYRARRSDSGKSVTVRVAVQEQGQGSLRFEVFPLTNFIPLYTLHLRMSGGEFVRHVNGERAAFPDVAELTTQTLGVALLPAEIVALLNGVLPPFPDGARWEIRRHAGGELTLRASDGRWRVKMDRRQQIVAVELNDVLRQKPRLQVQYALPRSPGPPSNLTVLLPRLGVRAELLSISQPGPVGGPRSVVGNP